MDEINNKIIATLEEMVVLKDQQIADLKEHINALTLLLDKVIDIHHGKDKS